MDVIIYLILIQIHQQTLRAFWQTLGKNFLEKEPVDPCNNNSSNLLQNSIPLKFSLSALQNSYNLYFILLKHYHFTCIKKTSRQIKCNFQVIQMLLTQIFPNILEFIVLKFWFLKIKIFLLGKYMSCSFLHKLS